MVRLICLLLVCLSANGQATDFSRTSSGESPGASSALVTGGVRLIGTGHLTTQPASGKRSVSINRVTMSEAQLKNLEARFNVPIQSGHYWYDRMSGLWGVEGGPTVGLILPGLKLPGPMPVDIAGGGTGIFINGRELHPVDRQGLLRLFGVANPGQYWLNAQGFLGPVGGPPLVNLFAAVQAAQRQQQSISHGYKYGGTGSRGVLSGGMYSGFTASGKSLTWYPGM